MPTHPNRHFKDAIYEQFARIGKAVSSPKRLELLDLLCQGPRTVEVLAGEANLTVANTSRHLHVLRGASLVETEKEGLFVTYRLADQSVCDFFRHLRILAEQRLSDIERIRRHFLEEKEILEPVDCDELVERVLQKSVTVIDVRPVEEYRAGHIPGALSVPLKELDAHLSELPRDQKVVAYCRGPYCVLAMEAVEMLRASGYRAARLEDSIQDWQAKGFTIEIAPEE